MKMIKKTLLTTLMLAFSASSFADSSADNKALAEQLNNTWNATFNKGDAKAVAQLYSEHAILSPGNGQILKGQQQVETLFQSFVDGGVHNHGIDIVESYREGNTLYQVAKWQANGQTKEGETPTFGGVVTLVSKLNDQGEWKLQLHSWNVAN
ncbi:hypothetical protein A9Q78_03875 [Methylophaga sp. 41_12_T18]|nr:hypothetical protein A9Q78_03875 [Methylophaga sp. 41_12_T18]